MMQSPTPTTEVIEYGTDQDGYQRAYVRRLPVSIEVEHGFGATSLTLRHFPNQRRPRDISHNLNVLPRRTFEAAKQVAIALVEGREAATANRTGEVA